MRRSLRCLTACLAVIAAAGAEAAASNQAVLAARVEFDRGQYANVITMLAPQLYPTPQITEEEDLEEAHYLLAVSHFYQAEPTRAKEEFLALLFIAPDYELDPIIESPQVYAFFEALKSENEAKLELIRAKKALEDERKKKAAGREITVTRVVHQESALNNFIPFGIPHFQRGHKVKGTIFLATQVPTLATSLGFFLWQAFEYGIPSRVPPAEIGDLQQRQVIQIGTGFAFLVSYGFSVAFAYGNQPPSVTESRTERDLSSQALVVPIVTPEFVGAAAQWEF